MWTKEISNMRPACCEPGETKYDQLEILKSCLMLLYITFNSEKNDCKRLTEVEIWIFLKPLINI